MDVEDIEPVGLDLHDAIENGAECILGDRNGLYLIKHADDVQWAQLPNDHELV